MAQRGVAYKDSPVPLHEFHSHAPHHPYIIEIPSTNVFYAKHPISLYSVIQMESPRYIDHKTSCMTHKTELHT